MYSDAVYLQGRSVVRDYGTIIMRVLNFIQHVQFCPDQHFQGAVSPCYSQGMVQGPYCVNACSKAADVPVMPHCAQGHLGMACTSEGGAAAKREVHLRRVRVRRLLLVAAIDIKRQLAASTLILGIGWMGVRLIRLESNAFPKTYV